MRLEIVNEYPALVWPKGHLVFLHERNHLLAHRLIARPHGPELHHVDGNTLNARPGNTTALFPKEHNAWHSRKG